MVAQLAIAIQQHAVMPPQEDAAYGLHKMPCHGRERSA